MMKEGFRKRKSNLNLTYMSLKIRQISDLQKSSEYDSIPIHTLSHLYLCQMCHNASPVKWNLVMQRVGSGRRADVRDAGGKNTRVSDTTSKPTVRERREVERKRRFVVAAVEHCDGRKKR